MIDAKTPINLTLPAGMCAVILEALNKVLMQYEVTSPVIEEVKRQIQAAEPDAFAPTMQAAPRVNGIDAVRD